MHLNRLNIQVTIVTDRSEAVFLLPLSCVCFNTALFVLCCAYTYTFIVFLNGINRMAVCFVRSLCRLNESYMYINMHNLGMNSIQIPDSESLVIQDVMYDDSYTNKTVHYKTKVLLPLLE